MDEGELKGMEDNPLKRQPKQERSKQIVDAVLVGATRVLSTMGLKESTTNKIAEVAGVGIGSLYDYFPNKESIVTALIDRRTQSVAQSFTALLLKGPEISLEAKIEEIVDFVVREFLQRRRFLSEIFPMAPKSGRMEAIYRTRVDVTTVVAGYLLKQNPELDESAAMQRAFFVMHGGMGILESYILIAPKEFSDEELARELREFFRFVLLKKD